VKLQHKVREISRRLAQNHNLLWFMLVAYLFKFAYTKFEAVDYSKQELLTDFYPWMDGNPLMDYRNYFYLLGERFFIMIIFFYVSRVVVCWQTMTLWILETLYIFDFLLTFHSSPYGTIKMIIMGAIFLLTLIKWKQ
jgi:hypothetical protein